MKLRGKTTTMSHITTTLASRGAVILAAVALLAGCSTGAGAPTTTIPGDWSKLTLAEAKLPAQLLRNETVNRIPSDAVKGAANQSDSSIPCLTAAEDPNETIRRWDATVDVVLTDAAVAKADQLAADVVKTYTDAGWMGQSITGANANDRATLLTIATSESEGVKQSEVRVEVQKSDTGAAIHIQANSECVITAGKDSDEVKGLNAGG